MLNLASASRRAAALCAVALCAAAGGAAHGAERMLVTDLAGSARVLRGVAVQPLVAGALLEAGDIVETGMASALQVEVGAVLAIAIGPESRVMFGVPAGHASDELTVSAGWVKAQFATPQGAARAAPWHFAFAPARVVASSGSIVAHAAPGRVEVFAESGEQFAVPTAPRGAAAPVRIGAERFALWSGDRPVQIGDGPAPDFIAQMPPPFRSPLYFVGARTAPVRLDPAKARDVAYAEVRAWLTSVPALRPALVARFRPRLSDPVFRRELDSELGATPDWKPILHPPPPPPPPPVPGPVPEPQRP